MKFTSTEREIMFENAARNALTSILIKNRDRLLDKIEAGVASNGQVAHYHAICNELQSRSI